MTDKALVSVIATVINDHYLDQFSSWELAKAILDKVEPIIRDNQRGLDIRQQVEERSDFLAKVLALPTRMAHDTRAPVVLFQQAPKVLVLRRDDVIALLTGGNDE